jgi:putative oxidoreductase
MNLLSASPHWTSRLLGLLRIVSALLFLEHGTSKLFGIPHAAMFDQLQIFSLIGLAGILEFVGGAMLLVGVLTRPVAFILSGEMAVAYFMAHAPHGFFPASNQGDAAVLFCFVFLYLSAAGAGKWSVDALIAQPSSGSKRAQPAKA